MNVIHVTMCGCGGHRHVTLGVGVGDMCVAGAHLTISINTSMCPAGRDGGVSGWGGGHALGRYHCNCG